MTIRNRRRGRRNRARFMQSVAIAFLAFWLGGCGSDSGGNGAGGGAGTGGVASGGTATGGAASGGAGSGGTSSGGASFGGTSSGGVSGTAGASVGGTGGTGGVAGVYPSCIGSDSTLYYACDATKSCVPSCGDCSGTPVGCLILKDAQHYLSTCVSSCTASSCAYGGLTSPDTCNGQCVDLQRSLQNCGVCGHQCPSGTNCDHGHCCEITGPSYEVWSDVCNMCCVETYESYASCPAQAVCVAPK